MINKNKKDEFFDQMQNYKLDHFNRINFIIMISLIFFGRYSASYVLYLPQTRVR